MKTNLKTKIIYFFWGAVFIAAGAGLLGGFDFEHLPQQAKLWLFAAASATLILTYFLDGIRKWLWLFPAMSCAGLAVILGMELGGMEDSSLTAVPIFASLTLPFYVGFAVERKRWGLLIPANIMAAMTVIVALEDTVQSGYLLALVLYAAGLPFLVIYLADRSKRWALISTAVMACVGTMPLVSAISRYNDNVVGPAFLFLFAICFFAIYFGSKNSWWAVIPAGTFGSFGLSTVVDTLIPHQEYPSFPNTLSWDVYIWVLFLGFAVTFGVLWLRRKTQPTGWAIYPATFWLAIAMLSFVLGERFSQVWPGTVLLAIGGMLLAYIVTRKKLAADQRPPQIET